MTRDDAIVAHIHQKTLFNQRTLAGAIDEIPFLFCLNDNDEISKSIRIPKNHQSPRLDGLTADMFEVSSQVIVDKLNFYSISIKWTVPECSQGR